MLERLLSITLAASLTGCYAAEIENTKEVDSFYLTRSVLEERSGKDFKEKKVKYQYKNGIEAEVTYKKHETGLKDIYLIVLSDPNNILVKKTPAIQTPIKSTYQKMFFENGITARAICFKFNRRKVVINLMNSELDYVTIDNNNFFVPPGIEELGMQKVEDIEMDLEIKLLEENLNIM